MCVKRICICGKHYNEAIKSEGRDCFIVQ